MKIVKVLVSQFFSVCNPMDCSPPGSSVHGILQARILEWVAIPFSRGIFLFFFFFQGIFLTQESKLGLLHFRWILYHLSYQGSMYNLDISLLSHINYFYKCVHFD